MLDITRAYGLDFMFPITDTTVGRCLLNFGEFAKVESDLMADYLRLAEPGMVIDVGANIGSISLPVAKQFPDQSFLAIEGHMGLAQILSTNAFGNHLYNVQVLHAVAGGESKLVDFPSVRLSTVGNFGSIGIDQVEKGVRHSKTRMLTLDEIATADTRFVKIDVEGYEPEVLKGAQRVLNEVRPVWLIEAARSHEATARSTIQTMLSAGYDVFWFYAPFVCKAVNKSMGVPRPPEGDHNIVAVPKGGPNLWDLEPILSADVEFPRHLDRFPYLKRYGF